MENKKRAYSQDFKDQLVKEVKDTGSITAVANTHGVSTKTLHTWVGKTRRCGQSVEKESAQGLRKALDDARLEILVLKELLKKTNQAWLKG